MTDERKAEIKRRIQAEYAWHAENDQQQIKDGITGEQFHADLVQRMERKQAEILRGLHGDALDPIDRSDGHHFATVLLAVQAMRQVGYKHASTSDLMAAIETGGVCCGYRWCRQGVKLSATWRRGRMIQQLHPETLGVVSVYTSVRAAALKVDAKASTIHEAAKHGTYCAGYYWRKEGAKGWTKKPRRGHYENKAAAAKAGWAKRRARSEAA